MSTANQANDGQRLGPVLARTQRELVRLNWKWLLLYFTVTSIPLIYLDYAFPTSDWSFFWLYIFVWASGYLLLFTLLDSAAVPVRSGIGAYFAVGLVTGLAQLFGMAAFVVPGLYLMLRWSPVYARCLASEDRIVGSIRWSWQSTELHQKDLVVAMIGPVALFLSGMVIGAGHFSTHLENLGEPAFLALLTGIHLLTGAGHTWLLLLGVASYLAIEQVARGAGRDHEPRPTPA